MKYIIKQGAPLIYIQWRAEMAGLVNEHYNNLQNPQKQELHKTLIAEQGNICGYTMRRIDLSSSHIEHIKPESLCRQGRRGSDLDYENMLACYPRQNMKNNDCYGARKKGHWWANNGHDFVSSLNQRCETIIDFNMVGEVLAVNNCTSATTTINVLRLDHPILTEDRKLTIEEYIFGADGNDPLPPDLAVEAINVVCDLNGEGMFTEFCVAIRQALYKYVAMLEQ